MLRGGPVRVLDARDTDAAMAVAARHPVENVLIASRLESCGAGPQRGGSEVWGYVRDGRVDALCLAGANLVPASADAAAAHGFAERAARQGRRCSSIVGPLAAVEVMWGRLQHSWGPAREVRAPQPHLVISAPPLVEGDPLVRRVRADELEILLPACVSMFTEEVGVSPVAGDGGALYRARVAELVAEGRSFARIEDGEVLFKAEVGAVSRSACQLQGVWVRPDLRGTGLGTAGTAAVVAAALRDLAPVVSLYVNDYNRAARAAYARVGFTETGAFASILF